MRERQDDKRSHTTHGQKGAESHKDLEDGLERAKFTTRDEVSPVWTVDRGIGHQSTKSSGSEAIRY